MKDTQLTLRARSNDLFIDRVIWNIFFALAVMGFIMALIQGKQIAEVFSGYFVAMFALTLRSAYALNKQKITTTLRKRPLLLAQPIAGVLLFLASLSTPLLAIAIPFALIASASLGKTRAEQHEMRRDLRERERKFTLALQRAGSPRSNSRYTTAPN